MIRDILELNYNIYCINLKERKDRYESACNEFKKIGILDLVKFHQPEKSSKGGSYGLTESILWCLQDALKRDPNKLIMTFEDDIHFSEEFLKSIYTLFEQNLTFFEDYSKWDTIRLGYWKGIFMEKLPGTPFYRGNCRATHIVIWSPNFAYKVLIKKISIERRGIIDWHIAEITGRHYLIDKPLCFQNCGLSSNISWQFSTIQKKYIVNPIQFQLKYEKRTIWTWKWVGRWLPMKIRGYVQILFVMDWEELIAMLLKGKTDYVFENKCLL
jgi:hypothetical protein